MIATQECAYTLQFSGKQLEEEEFLTPGGGDFLVKAFCDDATSRLDHEKERNSWMTIDDKRVRELCARVLRAQGQEFRDAVVELAMALEHYDAAYKTEKKQDNGNDTR